MPGDVEVVGCELKERLEADMPKPPAAVLQHDFSGHLFIGMHVI